jgi:hypothetical protein
MDSEIRKRQFLEESWIIKTRHEYGEYSSEARKEVFGNWFMWGASRFKEFYLNYLKDPKDNEKKKTFTESFEKRSSRLYEHEIYGVERFEEALAFLDSELLRTVDYDYQNAVRSFWGSDPFYSVPIEENGKKVMRIRYPDAALIQKRENQFSTVLTKYEQLCRKVLLSTSLVTKNNKQEKKLPAFTNEEKRLLDIGKKVKEGGKKGGEATRQVKQCDIRMKKCWALYDEMMNGKTKLPENEIKKVLKEKLRVSAKTINRYLEKRPLKK